LLSFSIFPHGVCWGKRLLETSPAGIRMRRNKRNCDTKAGDDQVIRFESSASCGIEEVAISPGTIVILRSRSAESSVTFGRDGEASVAGQRRTLKDVGLWWAREVSLEGLARLHPGRGYWIPY